MSNVLRSVRFRPSPNHGERRDGLAPCMLILHYTGMESGKGAEDWLCDPRSEVSSHYIVHEDGGIVRLVPEERRAWHAGKSCWHGIADVNSASIGIEIVNPGHSLGYPDFPEAQIEALIALCKMILRRWKIPADHVLAHSDVAPGRKIDPGEKFPWARLHREGIGLHVEPPPPDPDPCDAAEMDEVRALLAGFGYVVPQADPCNARIRIVLEAFQRHFRPARIDGIADRSTLATLRALLAARK